LFIGVSRFLPQEQQRSAEQPGSSGAHNTGVWRAAEQKKVRVLFVVPEMRKSATKQSNSKIIARHRHFAKLSLHISPLLLSTFLLWLSLNEGMCLSSFDRFD